jgi:hypothetical protein
MFAKLSFSTALLAASLTSVSAQTYRRLGTCPTLGCILPPDQADFLPGQLFDLRVEVHAPVNGSEAAHDGVPDENFKVTIAKEGEEAQDFATAFGLDEPEIETWNFSWYEDLFAEDEDKASLVNVAAKAYRKLALYEPGTYTVTLTYYDGETTTAEWTVRPIANERKAKNVIFFIGDGMTTNMVSYSSTKCPGALLKIVPDHCRPPPWTREHQRQVHDAHEDGRVPRPRPPDDPLHRLIHHRLCQLCLCSLHRPQEHRQRHGVCVKK